MEKRSYTKLYTKLCVTKMPQMVFIIWPSHQHNNGRRSRIRNVKVATVNSILIKLYILYIFPVEKKNPSCTRRDYLPGTQSLHSETSSPIYSVCPISLFLASEKWEPITCCLPAFSRFSKTSFSLGYVKKTMLLAQNQWLPWDSGQRSNLYILWPFCKFWHSHWLLMIH